MIYHPLYDPQGSAPVQPAAPREAHGLTRKEKQKKSRNEFRKMQRNRKCSICLEKPREPSRMSGCSCRCCFRCLCLLVKKVKTVKAADEVLCPLYRKAFNSIISKERRWDVERWMEVEVNETEDVISEAEEEEDIFPLYRCAQIGCNQIAVHPVYCNSCGSCFHARCGGENRHDPFQCNICSNV